MIERGAQFFFTLSEHVILARGELRDEELC